MTQLAYAGGKIWQENADNLWWSKDGAYDTSWNPPGGSPTNPLPQSPDSSVISQPDQFLVDASGTTWAVVNGQVAMNGVIDPTTNRVTELAYENGTVWQENADELWWSKNTATGAWNPPGGTSASPLAQSKDNAVISQPSQFIVDASGRTWTIVGGQVAEDGAADPATNRVTELAYENGTVWQENADELWWSKNTTTGAWDPPGGTPNSPVQSASPAWFGGNGAFDTAADWSTGMVPQPGDTAVIGNGSVGISSASASRVNFLFDGTSGQNDRATQPQLGFVDVAGPYDIGTVTVQAGASAIVKLDDQKIAGVTSSGIHLSAGSLDIAEFVGLPFTVNGDSSLANGASLTVQGFTGGEAPLGNFVNNGTMTVDASSAALGTLSGQGVVRVTDNSSLSVSTASAGETIQLQSGHLDIGRPTFSADITDFGPNSSVTSLNAQVVPGADVREVFAMSGPTSGELFIYKGTNVAVDLKISGQSHIYASYGDPGGGGITLTPYDTGNSIPIANA